MFINYQNYYWVEQGLPTINISDIDISGYATLDEYIETEIIGQPSYTTPATATPPNLKFTTGLTISFTGSALYEDARIIENFGGCNGIQLVGKFSDFTSGTVFEFLPWDGVLELSTGRVIRNENWDAITWDTQTQPSSGDYITIQRGSVDRNAWSRTNKWFHIDAITKTVGLTDIGFPTNASRALRPIIQFVVDLTLWDSGTQFNSEIQYGFRDNAAGNPMLLSSYSGRQVSLLNTELGISLSTGNLVSFFNDTSEIDINEFPWDTFLWDSIEWDEIVDTQQINNYIFEVTIQPGGEVTFSPVTSWNTPVVTGDIVFILEDGPFNGAQRGQTWYYETGAWQQATNDKVRLNQPPLFQLYDHEGVRLDNDVKYPLSNFNGNKIFSYKINTDAGATVDPVLKFPIVYSSLGQASDIVFQNNLMTDRYNYALSALNIDGYYYYKTTPSPVLFNNWNLYQPCLCADIVAPASTCLESSKQRVFDKYVVGFGTEYQFKLSVLPFGYPSAPDIIVIVNGNEIRSSAEQASGYTIVTINNELYVDLTSYITALLPTVKQAPAVELQTYTHGLLDPLATGFFQIPQQLEANPTQEEIFEISGSNLINQFSSIIANQLGATGIPFGGDNNYRDSRKNRSVGSFILQNVTPLLKTMLVSSEDDLSFVKGVRFSQDEYTKFKNRYLSTALQLINTGFNPVQYYNNTIVVSAWVDEILKIVNVSKEFSNAFAYSYMVANGSPYSTETISVPLTGSVTLSEFLDITDPRNSVYFYDVTGLETLLVIGVDYEIVSTNLAIDVQFKPTVTPGSTIVATFYKNPLPAYIPSTPTKVGAYGTFLPRIELDTSYVNPTAVIIGHDGSKTIAYNDYRDQLLLELEKRIYNLIQYKFRNQYRLPVRIEDVKSGFFRTTRYSRDEFLEISESFLNKWSAKNRANYRVNDWATSSLGATVVPSFVPGVGNIWKLYNYSVAVNTADDPLNLPGNWKGIFQYYYDTYNPDTRPWEMLGFSEQPAWWVFEYGAPVSNLAGQEVWASTANGNSIMYNDLEAGIIRQGPSAIYDPITLEVQPQEMWARSGLSTLIPVDTAGEIISVMDLFDVSFSGNFFAPFDGFEIEWAYGGGGPVEQAWMSTSGYAFSVQEFLYLMRPAAFGELLWDTAGTELSPGTIDIPGIEGPVRSNTNWQYVQNDAYVSDNKFFNWFRPGNASQIVHAETVDGNIAVRYGYQRWISDRILFLNKDVGATFGQKIRTLDVNLANKLAGFTNKDTTNTYIESISPDSATSTLLIPSTNFEVFLHTSPPVETYSYSGVVIRALADGTFVVYGYDLLTSEFKVFDRSTAKLIDVSIGGTPSPFLYFTPGATYKEGDIVRYNGVYYVSLVTQQVQSFIPSGYQKLRALPTVGGISVSYKPISEETITTVPYGTIFKSAQEVFDFLIGWGAYLTDQGWVFDEVSQETNQISNWLSSAKQFLFWLNTNWAPDASIQLSPLANKATLRVSRGYPVDVETMSNGVYSILDKFGVAIAPNNTATNREGQLITVEPTSLAAGGIYYLQVNSTETEHVLMFDNTTNFNDVVYSPLLRARQQRLRFNGFRSNGWYGKMEAPGYLIIEDELVPNFDTIVSAMRYYYDPNVTIDNPSLEDLGRHLIGYESKSYLDNLEVSNDVQYLFYQGAIRQKGTNQAFEKLFRSTKVQSDEIIEVYEEWALKLGEFGNSVEQVSTEFLLVPEQNTGEVIIARMNYIPSTIGFVKQINILNAETIYTSVPAVLINAPDALPLDPLLSQPLRQARAYAVLDSNGRIARVDITDPGYGYLSAPTVNVISTNTLNVLDRVYSVWQGEIINDESLDNIVDIDIDQTEQWIIRPSDPAYSLEFPTTPKIDYPLPNAGYVNFNDIDFSVFDVIRTVTTWGSATFNPGEYNTVWVAKTFTEDWNVYKLVNMVSSPSAVPNWRVQEDANGDLLLLLDTGVTIAPQSYTTAGVSTDYGNLIVLQQKVNGVVAGDTNYAVAFLPYESQDYNSPAIYTDPETLIDYNAYSLTSLDGAPITANDIGTYADFTDMLLFKTMRFITPPVAPLLPSYVGINDLVWVDNAAEKWAVFKVQGEEGRWDIRVWDKEITDVWALEAGWDVTGPLFLSPYRVQEEIINSSLFKSASVYSALTTNEIVQLPIYDPFKNVLPGPAKQNITYTSLQDPARYNVTSNERLFSENIIFAERQVGQLWWDLSSTRYVYYEQPIATGADGVPLETNTENLVYRRDHWAQIFPGSVIEIFEWVKSPVPPSQYNGTGIPRDVTTYVEVVTSNRFTNSTAISYYFWVLNATDMPNVENRTLAALDVARLLQSPKSQGYAFFAPIQQTNANNSYMFYNVQEILAYQGNNVQVEYRLSEREDQEHAQWKFFREGDSNSIVTDQFWNKMVDSICGYTKFLPASDEYSGITVYENLPWDSLPWDIVGSGWATINGSVGEVLPVPDPALSEAEKHGIMYRPRQGMFVKLQSARKIFVQAANELLQNIAIRDDNPGWNASVSTDEYWKYTNWYKIGFENVTPNVVFQTLSEATGALTAGQLSAGDIIQVTNGTIDGRFVLYSVVQPSASVSALSLEEVAIENSAIMLLNTVYTTANIYGLSVELRELLNAFRTQVMVNANIVDQNELFFSMINYVLSEQKNPDWVFKTSYIYIKENNVPLTQGLLFEPDNINNVIAYINDSKPYHTQIRDYTSAYSTNDIAVGTASDSYKISTKLAFGPDNTGVDEAGHWDAACDNESGPGPWDSYAWDVCPLPVYNVDAQTLFTDVEQFISREDVYTVPLNFFDSSRVGLSELYPYTFTFDGVNLNNPQTFIAPRDIVAVQIDTDILLYGQDYYVEYNQDLTYTVYFFEDPSTGPVPVALVLYDGGGMQFFRFNTYRNEIAYGYPKDGIVINVDTREPYTNPGGAWDAAPYDISSWDNGGIFAITSVTASGTTATATTQYPITVPTGSTLIISGINVPEFNGIFVIAIIAPTTFTYTLSNEVTDIPTEFGGYVVMLDNTISYKVNTNSLDGATFYRNADVDSGTLVYDLSAPTTLNENTDVITVSTFSDILPTPESFDPGVIWIEGERIEYKSKTQISTNVWELRLVRRGTRGTAPTEHIATTKAFVEQGNNLAAGSEDEVWNVILAPALPDPATPIPGGFTSVSNIPVGGLWYSGTAQAIFLKAEQGTSIP
jgi:hypothetical protein